MTVVVFSCLHRSDRHVKPAFAQSMQLYPLVFYLIYKAELEFFGWALPVAVDKMEYLAVSFYHRESRPWYLYALHFYTFYFYGLIELESALGTLESPPNVKFMISIDTCREIPAVKVLDSELFKSFNDLDFRGLALLDDSTQLRILIWTARVDFAFSSKYQGMRFSAGYLAYPFSHHKSEVRYLIFLRVLNGSQLIFRVFSTHKERVGLAHKTWMMTSSRCLNKGFLWDEYRLNLVLEISST